jgi:hypothetical protein
LLRGILLYAALIVCAAVVLQFLTPFPVLSWIFGWPAAKSP